MPRVLTVLVPSVLVVTAVLAPSAVDAGQRRPSVTEVMRRVAAYIDAWGARASIVVAKESYTQEALAGGTSGPERRSIVADFAIVRIERLRAWQGFRDVLEVNGRRLPERDDRLVRLLTRPGGGVEEARRLSDESARFNIGLIHRNFNVPTTTLFFFTADNLDRFRFAAKGVGRDGTWEIEFRETSRPTMIHTPAGQSIPSKGRLWVNPSDGAVLRTRLDVEGFGRRGIGRVEVTYRHMPALDMWVPVSMDEKFESSRDKYRDFISGQAVYTNYRTFTTSGRIK